MMNDYKSQSRKKKKDKRRFSFLIMIAGISLSGYFLYTIFTLNASIMQRKAEESDLTQKISDEQKKSEDLKQEVASIGTDAFVEKHAREVFGYVKENEKVFYDINNN